MLKPQQGLKGLLSSSSSQWICLACQSKSQWQYRRASSSAASAKAAKPSLTSEAIPPRPKVAKGEAPILQPLNHLIGVDEPPKVGQNPAKDPRPWSERRDAYWDKDAHTERRRKIFADMRRPYYRDWKRMRHHKGKTFLAPESPFRADVAKYFPNLQGYSLADSWSYVDTTKVLRGKISIVSYTSQTWAEWQVKSFVGKKENPQLASTLEELKDQGLQKMFMNYEDDLLKKILIYLFLWYARRKNDRENGKEVRARSLIVTRGVDREFFENGLGITNLRVGYTYLVDQNCKIRWVGNGYATDEEKKSIVRVARKLVQDLKDSEEKKKSIKRKPVEKKGSEPRPLGTMVI